MFITDNFIHEDEEEELTGDEDLGESLPAGEEELEAEVSEEDIPPEEVDVDPEWKNSFKTPEDMYSELKKQQGRSDKMEAEQKRLKDAGISVKEAKKEPSEDLSFEEQLQISPKEAISGLIKNIVSSSMGSNIEYLDQQRLKGFQEEVKKIYPDFDFQKNDKVLAEELSAFSEEFRANKPVEALLRAVKNVLGDGYDKKKVAEAVKDKKNLHTLGSGQKAPRLPKDDDEVNRIIDVTRKGSLLSQGVE